jgi:hypothetical protein
LEFIMSDAADDAVDTRGMEAADAIAEGKRMA